MGFLPEWLWDFGPDILLNIDVVDHLVDVKDRPGCGIHRAIQIK
jgi:hypothetical protein